MSFYHKNKAKQNNYFSSAKIGNFIKNNNKITPDPEIITNVNQQDFEELLEKPKKKKRLPGEKLLKELTKTTTEYNDEKFNNKMKRIKQALRKDIKYL